VLPGPRVSVVPPCLALPHPTTTHRAPGRCAPLVSRCPRVTRACRLPCSCVHSASPVRTRPPHSRDVRRLPLSEPPRAATPVPCQLTRRRNPFPPSPLLLLTPRDAKLDPSPFSLCRALSAFKSVGRRPAPLCRSAPSRPSSSTPPPLPSSLDSVHRPRMPVSPLHSPKFCRGVAVVQPLGEPLAHASSPSMIPTSPSSLSLPVVQDLDRVVSDHRASSIAVEHSRAVAIPIPHGETRQSAAISLFGVAHTSLILPHSSRS
jgi:hypothetical protein